MAILFRHLAIGALLSAASCNSRPAPSDDEQTLYAIGRAKGLELGALTLSPEEAAWVQRGFADATASRPPAFAVEGLAARAQALRATRVAARSDQQRAGTAEVLRKAAAEAGAVRTESGLTYLELVAGTGPMPDATSVVRVHYRGTLADGAEFDSSLHRGAPAEFSLKGVIPCWAEGLLRMRVGGKARLTCPPALAYGDQGVPPSIPGGAALVFEIELLALKSEVLPEPVRGAR